MDTTTPPQRPKISYRDFIEGEKLKNHLHRVREKIEHEKVQKQFDQEWEANLDRPFADIKREHEDIALSVRKDIDEGLRKRIIVKARESSNPRYEEAQGIIDAIIDSNKKLISQSPELYVHTKDDTAFTARATFPDTIETHDAFTKTLANDPKHFHAIMAHEIAHIVNGDTTVEARAKDEQRPKSRKQEILADRMAAILHGNVIAYIDDSNRGDYASGYEETHPSASESKQDLQNWAELLHKIGATSKEGHIIDLEKAMEAFKCTQYIADLKNTGSSRMKR